jgi:hypothetical protein
MSTRGLTIVVPALAALLGMGCSDDTVQPDLGRDIGVGENAPPPCALKITAVNGRAVATVSKLTDGDDQDSAKPGIQIDVEVSATNPPVGGELRLNVTGLTPDPSTAAAATASFKGVTVGVDLTTVVLKAYASGCTQDTVTFPVVPPPECVFLQPPDGASLAKKDDKNQATAEFEYDVKVYTKNAEGGQVTLIVGAATLPGAKTPDAMGTVTFSDAILPEGIGTVLKAEVSAGGVKRSCEAKVNISTGAPKCVFLGFNPAPITTSKGKPGLGIAQDVAPGTPGIQTNVEVQTETIPVQVSLLVGGAVVKTVTASGGVAKLDAVTIADGERDIQASCSSPSGVASKSTPTSVTVDSAAPSAIADLACTVANNREGKLSCSWTAVGDGTGSGMEAYDLRYTIDAPLSATSWATATKAKTIVPSPQGLTQTVELPGLKLGHTYYLGMRASDLVKNETAVALPTGTGNALVVDFKAQERALTTAAAWGSVMAAGDFDCDGYTDLAVGDPAAETNKGKVYIYLGSKNGLSVNPVKLLNGTVAGGRFGARLAMLTNFDGDADGCNDLAVTASYGDTKDARVYIYFGRKLFFDRDDVTTGLGAEVVYKLAASATATQRLGAAIAGAGDFDADGQSDLAVSWLDTGAADAASVFVLYGDKTIPLMGTGKVPLVKDLPAAAGVQVTGGKASASFGLSLGAGAQLDADLYAELLIGAKDTQVSGAKRGAAHLVKGAARAATLPETITLQASPRVITIAGGASNGAFGAALGLVGDMDKDGSRELAVSDPTAATGAGVVYLFNLKTPPTSVANAVGTVANDLAGATGNAFGQSIADAATFDAKAGVDFQNDGYADLCAGAKANGSTAVGAVFQVGGATLTGLALSKAAYTWSGPAAAPSFGAVVLLAKDLNGDGYVDLIVGDPQANAGKGRLFAYY